MAESREDAEDGTNMTSVTQDERSHQRDSEESSAARRTPVRAALASFMGSAVEYYDFFVFGSAAALIFPVIFFGTDDQAALVMSFATFGFAYRSRGRWGR